ncbi:AMP-binding protein [Kribbella sp. NBC_01505]|uniref:AMP-binding protein n=1 Tax=Kribbella sp. NBC_01505 TaxID=2903580 RepID=UPI00386F2700
MVRSGTRIPEDRQPATSREDESSPVLLHHFLARAAAATPSAIAVRDFSGSWTYCELATYSARFATWLRNRGVMAGGRVLLHHERTRHAVAMLYGTSSAGATLVPVSPAVGDLRLAALVDDAAPSLVVTSRAGWEALDGRMDRTTQVIPIEAAREYIETTEPRPIKGDPASPDDLAFLLYTSGSTSSPKAVMCPHRQVVFATQAIAQQLQYRPDDKVFCRLPTSFDYGLYQALLCALAGSELQLMPDQHDVELLTWVKSWAPTVIPLVPSLAAMMTTLAARADEKLPHVRLVTNTGEVLRPNLIQALREYLPSAQVALMFGVTECKRISILEPDGDRSRPGSVGRPLPGTEVTVTDESGLPIPSGELGEFVVRGPHVAAGYWRAPELTMERFPHEDGEPAALRTGDFGYIDSDGYLYFAGRRDDIFKRHGVRMSASEIEAAAVDIPGVAAAALLPPTRQADMTLVVAADLDEVGVLRELRRRLEPAKVPSTCVVIEVLPLTPNGKIDRRKLEKIRDARG